MADFRSSGTSDADLVKHLMSYGVEVSVSCRSWLQPFFSYPPQLEFPEAFDESVSDWNFYTALQDCLDKIGVTGLRWKDLHEPSSKQVKRILHDIIDFARFCEWQEGKANAMEDEVMGMADENADLEQVVEQLRREYEVACADHDDREAKLCELEDIYLDEQGKLESLTREYETLMEDHRRAQEAANHSEEQLLVMEEKRQGTLTTLADLKENLCQDYEAVLQDLKQQKHLADEHQRETIEASKQASSYTNWIANTKQIESDVITTIQLLEETLEAQEQAKIAEAKVTEVDKTIGSLESKTAKAKETVEAENIEQQARKLEREHEISRLQQEADKASEQLHFENVSAAIASRIEAWQEEINDGNLAVKDANKRIEEIACVREARQEHCIAQYGSTSAAVASFINRTVKLLDPALQRHKANNQFEESSEVDSTSVAELQRYLDSLKQTAQSLDKSVT